MKKAAMLSIRGRQSYDGQEPEVIELVTEGTMEFTNGGWDIAYDESELTGLAGVHTVFRVEPGKVTLTRTGQSSPADQPLSSKGERRKDKTLIGIRVVVQMVVHNTASLKESATASLARIVVP